MARKQVVIKEGTINIGGIQLQVIDGQVNSQDQSPEGQELLTKIAKAISGEGEEITVNLDGAGGPPMGDEMGMGGEPPMGDEMGMGEPMEPGGAIPDEGFGAEGPHFPGETEEEHETHEASETPEEEAAESESGEEGSSEPPEHIEAKKGGGEEEDEEEGEEDEEEDEGESKGPPKKGKNPFADDINRIAGCISEDIRVNNGKVYTEGLKKKVLTEGGFSGDDSMYHQSAFRQHPQASKEPGYESSGKSGWAATVRKSENKPIQVNSTSDFIKVLAKACGATIPLDLEGMQMIAGTLHHSHSNEAIEHIMKRPLTPKEKNIMDVLAEFIVLTNAATGDRL
jgi:hypothetical protein